MIKQRCFSTQQDHIYNTYHDEVWGRPVYDSLQLFEKLCLDGQQAGLSWITILKKQASYEAAYANFDPKEIASFGQDQVEALMLNPGIVRNRLKINSIIKNAQAYLRLEQQGVIFSDYLWSFVGGEPRINNYQTSKDIPATSSESEAMSKALKKDGFNFVGPTICYAFMQAAGLIIELSDDCDVHNKDNLSQLLVGTRD
ncbi:DNA-3-methyladenine glycosylase I [Alginatibacterium sediminis]|uniref:DNA-3-methyladenine glycosylase I n=1 Tax=Alginatibacterium sediminis TaxID=2164068 RepID=A0A420ELT2_9ALTE|nr:DNA-3-methyladenine glycosylase I [Alginatibacterium sediminis]RKF21564.1 DNA-3-methyladenine glycosylase I [Alginatibacterium sediminis]